MYKTTCLLWVSLFTCVCNVLVFCGFKVAFSYLLGKDLLPKRICSLNNFEFAPREFAPLRVFCRFVFT